MVELQNIDGGGLLTELRHCGRFWRMRKLWALSVQASPLTFIAASLLAVVFLSGPLSADMRVSCNSNGSGL